MVIAERETAGCTLRSDSRPSGVSRAMVLSLDGLHDVITFHSVDITLRCIALWLSVRPAETPRLLQGLDLCHLVDRLDSPRGVTHGLGEALSLAPAQEILGKPWAYVDLVHYAALPSGLRMGASSCLLSPMRASSMSSRRCHIGARGVDNLPLPIACGCIA